MPTSIGTYIAHDATTAERALYWARAAALYLGYPPYQQRTHGQVIQIMVDA